MDDEYDIFFVFMIILMATFTAGVILGNIFVPTNSNIYLSHTTANKLYINELNNSNAYAVNYDSLNSKEQDDVTSGNLICKIKSNVSVNNVEVLR